MKNLVTENKVNFPRRAGRFERKTGPTGFHALRAFAVKFPRPLQIVHAEYAIKLTLEGHGAPIRYRGREYEPCASARVAVFEPFEPIVSKASPSSTSFLTLFVDHQVMRTASEVLGQDSRHWFGNVHIRDTALMQEITALNQEIAAGRPLWALETGLCSVLERILDFSDSDHAASDNRAARCLRDLILDRLTEHVSLDMIEKEIGLSRFHLVRMFRKRYGVPPHEFHTHARIARARTLLAQGCSQADVALEVGFFDQSHLHRHFRRIMGISPGEFQHDLRK